MSQHEVSVGLSRKWNAYEAGREVAQDALHDLVGKPKFVVLICTHEYYPKDGYHELLRGVWEILPPDTKLIGGVVGGFIIPQGCFSWGTAMLAVSYKNMDVASSVGINTRANPKKVGKKVGEEIRKQLSQSSYKHGFAIDFTDGPNLPKMPIIGRKKVHNSKVVGNAISFFLPLMQWVGWGMGRENDVRTSMMSVLQEFKALGISTWDDRRFSEHRQFHGKDVYTNAIVAVGFKADTDSYVSSGFGFKKTDIHFQITKMDRDSCIVKQINKKPARQEYVRILHWHPDDINESHMKKTFFILPSYEKEGALYPVITGLFYGDYIVLGGSIEKRDMTMLTATGKSLLSAVDEAFHKYTDTPLFALISECSARQEALGTNIFTEKTMVEKYLNQTPYLLVFSGGEFTYTPEEGCRHKYESFCLGVLNTKKENTIRKIETFVDNME